MKCDIHGVVPVDLHHVGFEKDHLIQNGWLQKKKKRCSKVKIGDLAVVTSKLYTEEKVVFFTMKKVSLPRSISTNCKNK